ncbi:MAG: hypothetical protein JST11_06730 [Acidobacteria bacterium]|nr:hypothetical protein [Acidobacteriota bacterium]
MRALLLLLPTTLCLAQPPAINQEGVFNAASRIPPSLPGGGLAPGARFVIRGLRFEAGSKVRIAGQDVRLLSVSPTEILALMPPAPSAGYAEVTVSNSDGVSRPFRVRIVPAAFGFFSANGKSWGPAKMERPYLLTGTGLGGVRNPEVFVAGKPARVLRAGPRPGAPGIDEIEFAIPDGTPAGCFVPVLARIPGGPVSNTVAVPVGECKETAIDSSVFLLLTRMSSHIRTFTERGIDFTQDFAAAVFAEPPAIAALLNPWRLRPPVGTCTAYTGPFYPSVDESTLPGFFADSVGDAGHAAGHVVLRGARATVDLPQPSPGLYHDVIGADKSIYRAERPLVLSPGDFTLSWNSGTVHLAMPSLFSWTNASRIATVTRSEGLTVEWKSREPMMGILVVNVDADSASMGACFCLATGSRFHVPPESLANVPPGSREPGLPLSLVVLAPLPELQHLVAASGQNVLALVTTLRAESVDFQ